MPFQLHSHDLFSEQRHEPIAHTMEAENALHYARHEDCFVDHHKHPFDIAHQLSSLQNTTFAPQENCLAEEHGRYPYDLPPLTFAIEEEPDRLASQLNEFEEKCRQSDFLPRMLPRWNDIYQNLPLPTRFIDLDFHPEVDLEDFIAQIRSKRDPDLAKIWLPILRVEDAKDEGLKFPLRAQRLARLLWHELENERASTDADQEYMDEISQEADRVIRGFTTTPISSSRFVSPFFRFLVDRCLTVLVGGEVFRNQLSTCAIAARRTSFMRCGVICLRHGSHIGTRISHNAAGNRNKHRESVAVATEDASYR